MIFRFRAGGLAIVDPLHQDDPEFVFRQVEILKNAHHNRVVILQGHTKGCEAGCAAMAAKYPELKGTGPDAELRKHIEVQYKARQVLQERYPELKVVLSVIKPEMIGAKEWDRVYLIP
ncbi:hypothetical protein HZA86_03535 [Candidatus Uhrbacteria bacterium]|nr:hypothetical protein [Candidatus Uhrbacteria bacterium]